MVNSNVMDHGSSVGMQFSRLSFEDIPLISKLLMSTWPQNYGKVGSPVFSKDHLEWILGGPNKSKNVLVGGKIDDELVAYQTFLFRRVAHKGVTMNGYLCTHVAISSQLPAKLRFNCVLQMSKQHALFMESSDFFQPEGDLVYAFYDEGKQQVKEVLDKILKKNFRIERQVYSLSSQYIILPNRLKKYLREDSVKKAYFEVRPVLEGELSEVTQLFNHVPNGLCFTMQMTEDELRHHCLGHSDHHMYVVVYDGVIEAFINFYPLEIIKQGSIYKYIVVEFLITRGSDDVYVASLLGKALDFGEKIGAEAIVLENATYLDYSLCCKVGLVPSFRKMIMTVTSRDPLMECLPRFRIDVK
jgi:hypothetical protein